MANWPARTIRNWRWWVAMPCVLALTPVLIVDFVLWGSGLVAEFAVEAAGNGRNLLATTFKPYTRAISKWARQGAADGR